jgi:hypothetical protein
VAFDLSSLRERGRRDGPALTRIAVALASAAMLVWTGLRVARVDAARRAELRQLQTTLATFADWRRRFEPAVAAESIGWRRTLMELQGLGVIGDERLALTQTVGRAAETSGLQDVRVVIAAADTTGSDERLSTEGVRRRAASFGLIVECRGSLQAVANFLGELPPSVAPTALSLARQDGRARHRIVLAVYELQLSNESAALSPVPISLERGDSRRLGIGRAGG